MADMEQLNEKFSSAMGAFTYSQRNPVELILGVAIMIELAQHETIYDQERYDVVFEGVNRAFGWSRVQLQQNIQGGERSYQIDARSD